MELGEIGLDGMDLIGLVHDLDNWGAVVNAVMNHRIP
jgi:hypothetical protein